MPWDPTTEPTTPTTAPEARDELARRVSRLIRTILRPPSRLPVDLWADEFRVLATESGAIGGRFQTSRVEVARAIMRAVTEPGVEALTAMVCTQLFKTTLLENVFGRFAHLDPCPMLLVEPKDEAVESFSVERLAPMIRATPVLKELIGDARTRVTDNKIKFKRFPGGFLALVGAGSPTNLASRPIRLALYDEVDKYELTKEGDAIALGDERLATFRPKALSIRVCSPTLTETSRINQSWETSDQRRPFVPCPHCGHEQVLDFFASVHWPKSDDGEHLTDAAQLHCDSCGAGWTEAERRAALQKVQWRQTRAFSCCGERQDPRETRAWDWDAPNLVGRAVCRHCGRRAVSNRHAGFNASKLYSPWDADSIANIARKWIESKDDPELRQTFFNTQLGLPVRFSDGAELSTDTLMARREAYPEGAVPDGVLALTAGIDVQSGDGGRLEVEVVGWGLGEESWSIAWKSFEGNLAEPAVWARLDDYLKAPFRRDGGATSLRIQAACIDSGGHHTEAVYQFSKARLGRRVWAIKGASERTARRAPVWPNRRASTKYRKRFTPVMIGVNAAKDTLARRLALVRPGPGYCHFPADRESGYFEQLTAESLVFERRAGTRVAVWRLKKGRANEALDCRVYAYAALAGLYHHGFKLEALAAARSRATPSPPTAPTDGSTAPPAADTAAGPSPLPVGAPAPPAAKPPPKKTRKVARSRFMGR